MPETDPQPAQPVAVEPEDGDRDELMGERGVLDAGEVR